MKKNLSTYGGDKKYLLFKTIGIDGSKNECGINCIKKLGYGELIKKNKPINRIRLFDLGENTYFGDYEIYEGIE